MQLRDGSYNNCGDGNSNLDYSDYDEISMGCNEHRDDEVNDDNVLLLDIKKEWGNLLTAHDFQ